MNIIRRVTARLGSPSAQPADVQASPVTWQALAGQAATVTKVDHVLRSGDLLLACGWSQGPGQLRLAVDGKPLPTRVVRTARADVARYLGLSHADGLGMVLVAEAAPDGAVHLECLDGHGEPVGRHPLKPRRGAITTEARAQLQPALDGLRDAGLSAQALGRLASGPSTPGSAVGFAAGALDDARSSSATRCAVVGGWLVATPGTEAWLETSAGRRVPLEEAHRIARPDVAGAIPPALAHHSIQPGFLALLEDIPADEVVRLVVRRDGAEARLAELPLVDWGVDTTVASRWLLNFPTPVHRLAERIRRLDLRVLEPMLAARAAEWDRFPVQVVDVGPQVPAPRASLVIPLYGRFDFVEHQLLAFSRDAWLRGNVEVVYVIDDPALVERMAAAAWTLQRLYGVPFRWIWGGTNRGFSGANNLGALHARAEHLVFLNSDAFPRAPGWVPALLAPLQADPGLGAVGPRLLFGDGSIQHAGMVFRRREDLDIWTNHHPMMGLDPALDPHRSLVEVPCVTGACLAMRREDLARVGGWDAGYLIGDFEDSDLCLKLRAAGLRIGYLPTVELTHLERQSFKLVGEADFRTRVVVYNAVRHESRWREALRASAAQAEKAE